MAHNVLCQTGPIYSLKKIPNHIELGYAPELLTKINGQSKQA